MQAIKFHYYLKYKSSNGVTHDITKYVTNLGWEEKEGELAARISFTLADVNTLSKSIKPGCWVVIQYAYGNGAKHEAVRGKVVEWKDHTKMDSETLDIKAYDLLYDFQESYDNLYFKSKKKTKKILKKIFKKWHIKISKYNGANVKHGKIAYRNKKLGSAITDIIKEAEQHGGKKTVIRAVKNRIYILKYGTNKTVHRFVQKENITEVTNTLSTVGMVTRVKVIGQQKDNKRTPVYATIKGKTQYGIRQKFVTKSKNESLKKAKKEAKMLIKTDGAPKHDITFKTLDIPSIRKGDKIYLDTKYARGNYYVLSITHDCDSGTMSLSVKAASSKSKKTMYKVGQTVHIKRGKKEYTSANGKRGTNIVGVGRAKIKKIKKKKRHPYYVVTTNWSICHVHGWVSKDALS